MKKNKKTWIAVIPLFLIVVFVLAGFGALEKIPRYTYGKPGRAIASDNQDLK